MTLRALPVELKDQIYTKLALANQMRWKAANSSMARKTPHFEDHEAKDRLVASLRLLQHPVFRDSVLHFDYRYRVYCWQGNPQLRIEGPASESHRVDTAEEAALVLLVRGVRDWSGWTLLDYVRLHSRPIAAAALMDLFDAAWNATRRRKGVLHFPMEPYNVLSPAPGVYYDYGRRPIQRTALVAALGQVANARFQFLPGPI